MNDKRLTISKKTFEGFCSYLEAVMGLFFSKENQKGIELKISSIVHAFGGDEDPEKCLIEIMQSPVDENLLAKLALFLSVGETYFFRDSSFFALLENQILPDLIQKKQNKKIRIWSMGCATGEEPYSIAILLNRLIPDIGKWDITILGSDINKKFLHRAETGIYKKWSFRTTAPEIQSLYFEKTGNDQWLLKPAIRNMVTFRFANLVDCVNTSGSFDLILCNNVLIYFTPEKIAQAANQLAHALAEEGFLCVTAIEVPYIQNPYLVPCHFGNIVLFKKTSTPKADNAAFITQTIHQAKEPVKKTEPVEYFKIPEPFNKAAPAEIKTLPKEEEIQDPLAGIEALFKANLYSQVVEKIEPLLKTAPDISSLKNHLTYIHLLIQSYANQKKLEDALIWCQKSLEIHPLDPQIYCLQAKIFQELKQPLAAAESLRKALYLDPDLVIAHFELGCVLLQQKLLKESDRHFRNALLLLEGYADDAHLPGAEGLEAGNLKRIILRGGLQSSSG